MKKFATPALIAIALTSAAAFAQVVTAAPPPTSLKDAVQQLLVIVIGAVTAAAGTVLTMALHKLQVKWTADAARADQGRATAAAELVGTKLAHFSEVVIHGLSTGEFAKMLAQALVDLKIDPKEWEDLKRVGIEQIRELMGADGLKDLQDALGITGDAVDTYLEGQFTKAMSRFMPFGMGAGLSGYVGRTLRATTGALEEKAMSVAKEYVADPSSNQVTPNPGAPSL